jgi:hypothetical protein
MVHFPPDHGLHVKTIVGRIQKELLKLLAIIGHKRAMPRHADGYFAQDHGSHEFHG